MGIFYSFFALPFGKIRVYGLIRPDFKTNLQNRNELQDRERMKNESAIAGNGLQDAETGKRI
jgi:hypothetical protein